MNSSNLGNIGGNNEMKHGIDRNKIQTHLNTNYLLPYKLFPNLMKLKQFEDEQILAAVSANMGH